MTSINITPEQSGSNNSLGLKNMSVNQSAWKKELESQLYNKQKDTSIVDKESAAPLPQTEVDLSAESSPFSDLVEMQSGHAVEEGVLSRSNLLNGKQEEINDLADISSKNRPSNKSVEGLLSATAVPLSVNVVQAGSVSKAVGVEMPLMQTQSYLPSKIKPFNIRLLADGELLVRDYKQGLLSEAKLENIVADLKKIVNVDIEKVRINGDVVWQSDKKPTADQYIIDLV